MEDVEWGVTVRGEDIDQCVALGMDGWVGMICMYIDTHGVLVAGPFSIPLRMYRRAG